MNLRLLSVAACILCVPMACSDNKGQGSNQTNTQSAAAGGAAPTRPAASPELFTRAVDCAATFESVATLYRVIGDSKTGAERERMMQSAEQRAAAMRQMATRAGAIGTELGMARTEIAGRVRQARERLQQESRVGDFGDFAVRMGREADRCVAAMPELL
jgi:hypothetical protein